MKHSNHGFMTNFIKVSCMLLLIGAQSSFAEETDRKIRRAPAGITIDADKTKTIQPRTLQIKELPAAREPRPIQERRSIETSPAPVRDSTQFTTQKQLEPGQRIEIKRKLNELKIQTNRVREDAHQLERHIVDKQRILNRTTQPQVRRELQLEIGRMREELNSLNNQITDLENQQQIMRQMTTGQQGFADEEEHLSDSGYGPGQSNTGDRRQDRPCFIATAAYGSALAKEVQVLREFRDEHLIKTELGRSFIAIYDNYSPPIAAFIAQHDMAKSLTRSLLWPVVTFVKYPVLILLILSLSFLLGIISLFRQKKKFAN